MSKSLLTRALNDSDTPVADFALSSRRLPSSQASTARPRLRSSAALKHARIVTACGRPRAMVRARLGGLARRDTRNLCRWRMWWARWKSLSHLRSTWAVTTCARPASRPRGRLVLLATQRCMGEGRHCVHSERVCATAHVAGRSGGACSSPPNVWDRVLTGSDMTLHTSTL